MYRLPIQFLLQEEEQLVILDLFSKAKESE
jgi:hypothetical protein